MQSEGVLPRALLTLKWFIYSFVLWGAKSAIGDCVEWGWGQWGGKGLELHPCKGREGRQPEEGWEGTVLRDGEGFRGWELELVGGSNQHGLKEVLRTGCKERPSEWACFMSSRAAPSGCASRPWVDKSWWPGLAPEPTVPSAQAVLRCGTAEWPFSIQRYCRIILWCMGSTQ